MFERFRESKRIKSEMWQLRRQLPVVRHQRDALRNENAALILDRQKAKEVSFTGDSGYMPDVCTVSTFDKENKEV